MGLSLDCFRCGQDELTVIVTGAHAPPVVTDRDSGACVCLTPAAIDDGIVAVTVTEAYHPTGAWMANLPVARDACQVRFALAADGVVRTGTVRWPASPEPAPEPAPAQVKRSRRRAELQ